VGRLIAISGDRNDMYYVFVFSTAYKKLLEANGGRAISPIVWTSDMTSRARNHLNPKDYIIQIWTSGIVIVITVKAID